MGPGMMTDRPGGPPASPPAELDIWVTQSSGPGMRTVEWMPADGNWTLVVMQADGSAGIDAQFRAGVTAPGLPWLAAGVVGLGLVLLITGGLMIALAARRATGSPPRPNPAPSGWPPSPTPGTSSVVDDGALVSAGGYRR